MAFVDSVWLEAYFTLEPEHTVQMAAALRLSDERVAELLETDHLVISTPVYNYNVPAALKAWIDHVVRNGLTLGVDGKGLITDKKARVILASGGIYAPGSPIESRDIATQYLKLILNVSGFVDVNSIAAGGAKAVDLGETGMGEFLDSFDPLIQAALG